MPRQNVRKVDPDRKHITHWTMEKLGRKVGVTSSLVGYWMRGQRVPQERYIDKLVEVLNIERETLLEFFKKKQEEWKEKIRLEDLED